MPRESEFTYGSINNGGNLSVDLSQGGLGNLEASGDFGH